MSPKEIESFPDERARDADHRQPGRAAVGAAADGAQEHPQVKLHSGDTIIFSATPIPGNERAVNETVDRLYQIGATVITTQDAAVHASGHGWSEELKLMLNLTKPRYVMPIHGDHKRLLPARQAGRVGRRRTRTRSSRDATACRSRSTSAARASASRSSSGVVFVDGVEVGRHRGRRAARPPRAVGGRDLHRGRDRVRPGRPCRSRRPR